MITQTDTPKKSLWNGQWPSGHHPTFPIYWLLPCHFPGKSLWYIMTKGRPNVTSKMILVALVSLRSFPSVYVLEKVVLRKLYLRMWVIFFQPRHNHSFLREWMELTADWKGLALAFSVNHWLFSGIEYFKHYLKVSFLNFKTKINEHIKAPYLKNASYKIQHGVHIKIWLITVWNVKYITEIIEKEY